MADLSDAEGQLADDPGVDAQTREFRWRSELQQRTVRKAIWAVGALFLTGGAIALAGVWIYHCTGKIEWPLGALVASFMLPGTVICAIAVRAVSLDGNRKDALDVSSSIAPHVAVVKDLLEIMGSSKPGA